MSASTDAADAIAQRRTQSLAAMVRDEIERMILGGEIAAGERINEQSLATRLGVSRGPIREATRALERSGLVTVVANHGAFVRQMSIEEAIELYELRAVVVGYASGRAAERATGEEKAVLMDHVRRMDEAIEAGQAPAYYELNLEFHDLVMQASRHRKSASLYDSLVKETHLFRRRALMSVAAMRESNAEHRAMVDAIVAGDVAAARIAAEAHHFNGKRRWLETL